MRNDENKASLILAVCSIIPVVWLALLTAPYVKDMDDFIRESTCRIPEFDNNLLRRLIASIKAVSADKLLIQFQSGIVMEQEIRYD